MKSIVNISNPVLDEVEECESSLDESSFPFILSKDFGKRNTVVFDSVISADVFVKMMLPVKHFLEGICFIFVSASLVSLVEV